MARCSVLYTVRRLKFGRQIGDAMKTFVDDHGLVRESRLNILLLNLVLYRLQ